VSGGEPADIMNQLGPGRPATKNPSAPTDARRAAVSVTSDPDFPLHT